MPFPSPSSPVLTRTPARRRALPPWPATRPLRGWQEAAVAEVLGHDGDAFLASATPAAGKTTFGLHVAHRLLCAGRVARVAIVAPTTHICRQWAADAARYGIDLEPNRPNADGPEPGDRHGVVVTYQTVAAGPQVHRRAGRLPTLLIADEPHHMGDQAAWGRSTVAAFERAAFRLLLSGTPFRSDGTAIPWVRYDADGVSESDFAYGYTDALLDGVCRPVTFHAYDGDMEWVSDGRRRHADFSVGLPAAEAARRLRTALDPDGDWLAHVLRDAHAQLERVRATDDPAAGGLVVAIDKEHADSLAAHLERVTGEAPAVVTSDAPDASARIARFAAGAGRWLVAVLMVSEGVDVPRLRVGVYATTARTELFFRQVVGRFVRRTPGRGEQMSHLFLPADPRLKQLAAQVEEERRHALALKPAGEGLEEAPPRERTEATEGFRALSSSARGQAEMLQTTQPGDALQLFADPVPPAAAAFAPVATRTTGAGEHARAAGRPGGDGVAGQEPSHARRDRLRAERSALVAAVARGTGEAHREIHARVNRAVGAPSVRAATVEQLERGNALLREQEQGSAGRPTRGSRRRPQRA